MSKVEGKGLRDQARVYISISCCEISSDRLYFDEPGSLVFEPGRVRIDKSAAVGIRFQHPGTPLECRKLLHSCKALKSGISRILQMRWQLGLRYDRQKLYSCDSAPHMT
jgi:hypothetical protein